ncbi:MAG: N-acetylglucosamine-6-phosphate deacetylase [Paracoccaceae bacterium]
MNTALTYDGRDLVSGESLKFGIENGKICSIQPCDKSNIPFIVPGFVDLQVNGFNGFDLNSGILEPETVEGLSEALCRNGVSTYLPTLITTCVDNFCQRLAAIKLSVETLPKSKSMVAGIHVEGPSVSPLDGPRGAHPKKHVRPPSVDEYKQWQEAADGLVKLITLAPEISGTEEFIKYVTSDGVRVALGHSDATEQDIKMAVDAGATLATHLGNGIAATIPRHPNAIWAQLAEDRMSASFIADGHHLPRSALISMIRAKGIERSILVSDSVVFAGMEPGKYTSSIGGDVEVSESGCVSIAGTPYLAGSGASLLDIVCGFPERTGLSLKNAVEMACYNPAKYLGLDIGLTIGASADFILFDYDGSSVNVTPREIVFQGVSVGP